MSIYMDKFWRNLLISVGLLVCYLITAPFIVGFLVGSAVWAIIPNTPLTLMTAALSFLLTCLFGIYLADKYLDYRERNK